MAMSDRDLDREERRRQQAGIAGSLKASGALDEIFARIGAGEPLTGHEGLLKATLERGLEAELSDHVGYDRVTRRQQSSITHVTGHSRRRWRQRSATLSCRCRVTATARSPQCWSRKPSGVSMVSTR